MIRKTNQGYKVYNEGGKPLSRAYPTKAQAEKRLSQVEYFKSKNKR